MHVALLRGVNVGGRNRLPMKDLAAMFAALECRDVATYIQSGNVVFRAPAATVRDLPVQLTRRLAKQLGIDVPVVLRSARELDGVVRGNPFLAKRTDEKALHVVFLAERPAPARVAALDPGRSPPDAFLVRGAEVFLSCPHGMARTKLTNDWFDRTLGTISTVRNWRTVLHLREMAAG